MTKIIEAQKTYGNIYVMFETCRGWGNLRFVTKTFEVNENVFHMSLFFHVGKKKTTQFFHDYCYASERC